MYVFIYIYMCVFNVCITHLGQGKAFVVVTRRSLHEARATPDLRMADST